MSSDAGLAPWAAADAASGSAPAVRVEHLSKVYRLYGRPQDRLKEMLFGRLGKRFSTDFWALHDISFELGRGQRLGVIGRNGSGKSTLLQILAGTLAPTAGAVSVNGRVAALLELGSGFNPEFTGRENIFLNASILGLSRQEIETRLDDIAAFADIGPFLEQPVKTYSSGMFMRLAFAVTTSVDADVLLIDEALAVGDVFFTQKCFGHLERLIDRGVSVVLVTHDTSAVNQFCERVVVLDQGRVMYEGDTVGGLRTYFALQRGGSVLNAASPVARRHELERAAGTPTIAWPDETEYLPLATASVQGTGEARCTAVALCDSSGKATDTFEMGSDGVFYYEFAIDQRLETPVGGISVVNERNLIVHGRNSLQYGVQAPAIVKPGSRLRFRQRVRMDLSPGRYTFVVGLAAVPHVTYEHAAHLTHAALHGVTSRILSVGNIGSFAVTLRRNGLELPFHGLCALDGDAELEMSEKVSCESR